jgi:hypothetical protein
MPTGIHPAILEKTQAMVRNGETTPHLSQFTNAADLSLYI